MTDDQYTLEEWGVAKGNPFASSPAAVRRMRRLNRACDLWTPELVEQARRDIKQFEFDLPVIRQVEMDEFWNLFTRHGYLDAMQNLWGLLQQFRGMWPRWTLDKWSLQDIDRYADERLMMKLESVLYDTGLIALDSPRLKGWGGCPRCMLILDHQSTGVRLPDFECYTCPPYKARWQREEIKDGWTPEDEHRDYRAPIPTNPMWDRPRAGEDA